MSRKYSYITDKSNSDRPIQVESAKRDGSGKNIENNYAKQNGNYETLTSGLAMNLDTKVVDNDKSAYLFRPTGGLDTECGNICKEKAVIGGTIVFNQLLRNGNFADGDAYWQSSNQNTPISVSNGVCSLTPEQGELYPGIYTPAQYVENHKYLVSVEAKGCSSVALNFGGFNGNIATSLDPNVFTKCSTIFNATFSYSTSLILFETNGTGTRYYKNIVLFDLTQMFGSTIADYIYSLEQANAGSGVAWFKRYFPKEYYAYNSGELVSVKTQGKKITHFNQWDEEWELGAIDLANGQDISSSTYFRSKNYTNIIPSTLYYSKSTSAIYGCFYDANKVFISAFSNDNTPFETPSNAYYVRFYTQGTTYNHDICINFHYDGERDGEYEPYNSETYPVEDIELRGIPQLDENNNLVFDGDEYSNDGNVNELFGKIDDLSSLTLNSTNYEGLYFILRSDLANFIEGSMFASKYIYVDNSGVTDNQTASNILKEGEFAYRHGSLAEYRDRVYFKVASGSLSGELIYHKTITQGTPATPFTEVQECDNWGTEEWLAPTTDTRPCEVPVGHDTDYPLDLKSKLEIMPNSPSTDGVYVWNAQSGTNTLIPIATWLANNGYKTEETMKDTFGMKDALGGTLRQLLVTNVTASGGTLDFSNTDYIDFGNESWIHNGGGLFYITISAMQAFSTKALCTKYAYSSETWGKIPNKMFGMASGGGTNYIMVKDTDYNDATAFKNAMKGVLLAYEKAS